MKKIGEISSAVKVCAVIGDPIGHSLSPQIHNAAFSATGTDLVYTAFHVQQGDLRRAMDGVRSLGIKGLSVTIPHKVDIIPFLDEIDDVALATGSVNTVVNSSGTLIGFTTDGPGAIRALEAQSVAVEGKRILLLGSGGAARAIAFALRHLSPLPVLSILGVVKPELEKLVEDLNKRGGRKKPAPGSLVKGDMLDDSSLEENMAEAEIIVHATPVGMSPETGKTLVPAHLFRENQVVFDVVYNPRETRLLKEARESGALAVSGLGMFVNQAAIQFELWTGKPAPMQVMTRAVEDALYSANK